MDLRLKYSYKFYIHVPFFHEKYIKILSKGNIIQPIKETIYIDLKHIECLLDVLKTTRQSTKILLRFKNIALRF